MDDDSYTRITLRVPRDLWEELSAEAARTSKSVNAEIVGRLRRTVAHDAAIAELKPMFSIVEEGSDLEERLTQTMTKALRQIFVTGSEVHVEKEAPRPPVVRRRSRTKLAK